MSHVDETAPDLSIDGCGRIPIGETLDITLVDAGADGRPFPAGPACALTTTSTHYRWTVSLDSMLHERHSEGDSDRIDGG